YKIGAIGRGELGNGGYKFADSVWGGSEGSKHPGMSFKSFINESNRNIHLKADEYLACGDNTRSSLDGRYWGPVPRNRLVGPALVVYWPLSKRWGHISR
ncbi:MAG: S26 family signal peptidase, partial [bacterium]